MTTAQRLSPGLHFSTPPITARGIRLVRAADELWRVQASGGRIIGHLRLFVTPLGVRYRAERLPLHTGGVRDHCEVWSPAEAVAALHS